MPVMPDLAARIRKLFPAADIPGKVRLADLLDGQGPRIEQWDATLGTQPTTEQLEAVTLQELADARLAGLRAAAKVLFDTDDAAAKRDRAIAGLTVDQLNVIRDWIADFKAAVAASGTLAALKTAVAALPDLGQITDAQARTAYRNRVDTDTPP